MDQQSPLTISKVHNALNKTFRGKTTKGYNWLRSHFPTSEEKWRIEDFAPETLQRMLECLVSKRKQEVCPYHARIHKIVERQDQTHKVIPTLSTLQSNV